MKDKQRKLLAIWLYTGAGAIFIQIILGGITRLTGSGLSITEWKPLLGAIPPMNTAAWQQSFDLYKQIAQFKVVNASFSLEDYKAIYFWEWLHRNCARLIGYLFLIPFICLLFKGMISRKMFLKLTLLLTLGLLQALIGWIMVKSGLNDTAIAVSEIRLAIHFITAILLLAYTLWLAFDLSLPQLSLAVTMRHPTLNGIILLVMLLQLFYGALMAGSKAALVAPTWPDMNGSFIPEALYHQSADPHISYLLAIQSVHRMLAYLLTCLVLFQYKKNITWKGRPYLSAVRIIPPILLVVQILLGIITLLDSFNASYKIWGIIHQANGILLFGSLLLIFYINLNKRYNTQGFSLTPPF